MTRLLRDHGQTAIEVRDVLGGDASDAAITAYAKANALRVATKDREFAQRRRAAGEPTLWLQTRQTEDVLDLQAVVDEIERQPGEERDVVVVALGRELSTVAWIESYNRHRPVNKIRLIDLRTDEKHGRFFEHAPASARVTFERADGRLRVRIDDVLSPSIMERLAGQEGVLAPQIADWRWVVDSIAIDSAYDGEVFDVDLVDIPARRTDLVDGTYDLEAPTGAAPAAVRITDMLGEEILVVEDRPGV